MKILITGACGFVGSQIALQLAHQSSLSAQVIGIDNLSRGGSERNRLRLTDQGIRFVHGDIRCQSDLDAIGPVDWVIDCAALPSVLSGVSGSSGPQQVIEHNLVGTLNMLEYCRRQQAGLILLSTSRVYSIDALTKLPLRATENAFEISDQAAEVNGVTADGINESFSTTPPLSIYGSTKLASEIMALEYASTFQFPLRINRCGVLTGAGQFARPDQGIFSYWINCYAARRSLRYIGFEGTGRQVRDMLHPRDLASLVEKQMVAGKDSSKPILANVSGGMQSACSLKQLSDWCDRRFEPMKIEADLTPRKFDLPWIVLDSTLAKTAWNWQPKIDSDSILSEIADHAQQNPDWLKATM